MNIPVGQPFMVAAVSFYTAATVGRRPHAFLGIINNPSWLMITGGYTTQYNIGDDHNPLWEPLKSQP